MTLETLTQPKYLIISLVAIAVLFIGSLLMKRLIKSENSIELSALLKPFKYQLFIESIILILLLLIRNFTQSYTDLFKEINWLDNLFTIFILVMIFRILYILLDIIELRYRQSNLSMRRPLKPIVQAIKIILIIVLGFGVVATILERDPFVVMGSISTIIAFVSFIFKDLLLGFFASIQISANDIFRIGDWIDVPNLEVSGTVSNVGITSVSLIPTNKSIITIPSYSLLQNPVINSRMVSRHSVRLFSRSFYFKPNTDMNLTNCVDEIKQYLTQHPKVSNEEFINLQVEEGKTIDYSLKLTCFTTEPEFEAHNLVCTELSLHILEIMAKNHCFN